MKQKLYLAISIICHVLRMRFGVFRFLCFFQGFEDKLVSLFENLAIYPFYLANELSNLFLNFTRKLWLGPFGSFQAPKIF